VCVCVVAS